MIQIKDVSMRFPAPKRYVDYLMFRPTSYFNALNNINLEIDEGDRVAFLGVNGAGKTTLLKLIGGLLYPTNGEINVNGYNTINDNLQSRKSVGFVLNEERSFYWRLTAVQNLEFFGVLDNLKGRDLNSEINDLLRLVGLEGARHKEVAAYSSGMKQRLALARGLLRNPKILILDEPTRTLDPQAVKDVKALISDKIHEDEQKTLLIATHRFDEVEELCNKICVMRNGELMAYTALEDIGGTSRDILEFYNMVMNKREESLV